MPTDFETTTPVAPPRLPRRPRSAWWWPPVDDGETVYGLNGRDRWVLTVLLVPMAAMIGLHGWRWAETERSAVTVVRAAALPVEVPPTSDNAVNVAAPAETVTPQPYVFRVDINTATWIEFAQLDGIGEKLAKRIVADRTEQGDFRTIEDLRRVKGIGAKTLEKMRPHLTIATN